MLDYRRFLLFFFLLGGFFLVVGCAADEPVATPTAVIPLTETPTQTPPPSATFTIVATETAVLTATPSSTPTNIPTETPPPTPSLPSTSVLFVRDGALQQWIPKTNEIKVLTENIGPWLRHSDDIVVFYREIIADEEKAFFIFHLPTKTEYEIFRTSTTPFSTSYSSITISPNSRWLAYVSVEDPNDIPTILIHEIIMQEQQIVISEPVLTLKTASPWRWPYETFSWATANELSWSDQEGIWIVDLASSDKEPTIAILPSENTFEMAPLNPAEQGEDPSILYTKFLPYQWSPNGRYLLVIEYFFEYGVFRVIERETNRSFEIPDSAFGPLSDGAIWLDNDTLLHFVISNEMKIWDINLDNPDPTLERTIFLEEFWEAKDLQIINGHIRFNTYEELYDLNLETEELIKLAPESYALFQWAPDNQYALGSRYLKIDETWIAQVFLVNLVAGTEKEMDVVFGTNSCCWSWYEEK